MHTILIIEDDEVLAEVLQKKLELQGNKVFWVAHGERAIAEVRDKHPDLVLLDINLPGKNGLQILSELQKDSVLKKTPVIVISNSGEKIEVEKLKRLGAVDHLVKANFVPDELLEKVNRFLRHHEEN